jgi:hypothetical protein
MPRTLPSLGLVIAALALTAAAAQAQTAAAKPDDTTLVPVFTPAAATSSIPTATVREDDHGDKRRIQSSELNDAVISSIPKYSPPKPVVAKADDDPTAAQDPDKPRNGIIRLPKYVVHDSTPPIFTKKDVLTPTGRDDLAMRQYIMDTNGMPTFAAYMAKQLFQANASQQYADAERASNISSLRSDANAAALSGDMAESKFIREQSNDTYLRRSDWGPIGSSTKTASSPGDAGGGNGQ